MPLLPSALAHFLSELRRRRVFRVAIAYVVVAWSVVQIAVNIFPPLHLPEWTITLVIVMSGLGFPLALVLAWAFNITPDGVVCTGSDAESESSVPPLPPGGLAMAPSAVDEDAYTPRSIVVLPFLNLSPDGHGEYLSDGMAEELINELARIDGLRVVARTSSFAFKGQAVDVREIGKRLGVESVLEGSVREAGDQLRISAQLIDARSGHHIWSEIYKQKVDDIFSVQEEISKTIVQKLRLHQFGGALSNTSPRNLAAYTLYLQGRYFWNRRTEAGLKRAAELFEQAIDADSTYAQAYTGLADAHLILMDYGLVAPREAFPPAKEAADRAVELDPALAEAHTALALVRQFEWNWNSAEAEFRRSLTLNPNYVVARHRYALFLAWMGRSDEAIREIRVAQELDPLSLIVISSVGWILYYARSYNAAIEECRHALDLDPNFAPAHLVLGVAALQAGRYSEAAATLEDAVRLSGESPGILPFLGLTYGRIGRRAEAEEVLTRLQEKASSSAYVSPYFMAIAHLGVGDWTAGLSCMEQAFEERAPQLSYLVADPIFDTLQSEARFQRLITRLGLPVPVS